MLTLQVDSPDAGSHPGQPLSIPLDKYRCTILGRLQPASLPADSQFVLLDSPTLKNLTSRQHFKITCLPVEVDDGLSFEYKLEDLKSMNGVLVNKRKVDRCVLADGDVLIIGAAKNAQVGQTISRDLKGISDLVYRFTADANAPTTATAAATEAAAPQLPCRTSSSSVHLRPILNTPSSVSGTAAAAAAAAAVSPIVLRASHASAAVAPVNGSESKQTEGAAASDPIRRAGTVSQKPSAKSRRRAVNGDSAELSAEPASAEPASAGESSSAASSSAGAAAAAASSSPARPASPVLAAAAAANSANGDSDESAPAAAAAAEGEGSSRPKVSLASHLLSFASTLNPFKSRASPQPAAAAAATAAEGEGEAEAAPSASSPDVATSADSSERRKKRLRDEIDGAGAGASASAGGGAAAADHDSEAAKRPRAASPVIDMTMSPAPIAAGSAADAIAAAASSSPAAAAAGAAEVAAADAAPSPPPGPPTRTGSVAASEARKQMASELSEEFMCAVCCELLVHAHALACSHAFCKSCLASWLATGSGAAGAKTCPACRTKIQTDPVPVKSIDNAIDMIAKTALTEEEREERKAKQNKDAPIVMPKVGGGGGGAGGGAGPGSAAAAAAVLARFSPAGGLPGYPPAGFGLGGFGGFGFPGFGPGAAFGFAAPPPAPAAAARAGPVVVDDDDDDGGDDDDDDEGAGGRRSISVRLERARSGRSRCRTCNNYIAHGEVSRRSYPSAASIPGFSSLTAVEKAAVQHARPDRV